MKLIAKKPCNFGGCNFFIGEEVPAELVIDPAKQEKLGVITISNEDGEGVSAGMAGTFTQEQVDHMIAEAVAIELEKARESMKAELVEMEFVDVPETVLITVNRESDGENEQSTAVPATLEEIQQVFSIMQLNAEEGAKAITEVQSENVLILLHATDSRKTIKNAAKEQVDNLFSTEGADA